MRPSDSDDVINGFNTHTASVYGDKYTKIAFEFVKIGSVAVAAQITDESKAV